MDHLAMATHGSIFLRIFIAHLLHIILIYQCPIEPITCLLCMISSFTFCIVSIAQLWVLFSFYQSSLFVLQQLRTKHDEKCMVGINKEALHTPRLRHLEVSKMTLLQSAQNPQRRSYESNESKNVEIRVRVKKWRPLYQRVQSDRWRTVRLCPVVSSVVLYPYIFVFWP